MKLKSLFILLILSSCYIGEELPPDQTTWEYDLPSNVGLGEGGLIILNERLKFSEFQQVNGLVIIKDDKLVFENYYGGDSRRSVNPLNAASMSLTVAAVGVALDLGYFSIEDKIQQYLPEYSDVFEDDNNKTFITIEHLLQNKSGFSWNEGLFLVFQNPENDINRMKLSEDWIRYVLEKPMEAPAGLRFSINSANGLILTKIIENVSGISFSEFIKSNIYQPLTISSDTISTDRFGNYNTADGIGLTLLDYAKFGYLMLEEGIWKGRRILDPNFVEEATSIQTNVSGTYNAGYTWRRFGEGFENVFGVDRNEIYFVIGEFGQHLYIIPSKKMVIAIDAENYFFGFGNPSLNLFAEITYLIQ